MKVKTWPLKWEVESQNMTIKNSNCHTEQCMFMPDNIHTIRFCSLSGSTQLKLWLGLSKRLVWLKPESKFHVFENWTEPKYFGYFRSVKEKPNFIKKNWLCNSWADIRRCSAVVPFRSWIGSLDLESVLRQCCSEAATRK